MCLFSCQYHVVLITVVLSSLKSGKVMPPALFFFFRIALAILGLLWFHMNFRIIFSSSVKNVIDNLTGRWPKAPTVTMSVLISPIPLLLYGALDTPF